MGRSKEQALQDSLEENRKELVLAVGRLRKEFDLLVDWRGQLDRHRSRAAIGSAVAGFVLAGGLSAFGRAVFSRRK